MTSAFLKRVAIALLFGVGVASAQQPARDAATIVRAGTGVIAGTVVAGADTQAPINRAVVTINAVDGGFGATVLSESDGTFRFDSVPVGRYRLAALKPAYLRANYGETRPTRPGVPIVVAENQQITGLVIPIWKGAVVSGTIRTASGEPIGSVQVQAIGRVQGRSDWSFEHSATTDDRGRYRIFGLPPGEYLVACTPQGFHEGTGATQTSPALVRWAESTLRGTTAGSTGPAVDPPPPAPATVGYANTYFPGTTIEGDATIIGLAAGEERAGLDIVTQFVPVAKVEGTVVDPSGRPATHIELFMTPTTGTMIGFSNLNMAMGTPFTFRGVAPGEYVITARTTRAPAGLGVSDLVIDGVAVTGAGEAGTTPAGMWATTTVRTAGRDVSGLVLTLQSGLRVSGRLAFDSRERQPPDLTTMRISLSVVPGSQRLSVGARNVTVKADGTFEITGLVPGRYLWRVDDGSPQFRTRWMLQSIVVDSRDGAHSPLDLTTPRNIENVVVTLTDRLTELAGTLQDAGGRAAPDFHIVVFGVDRADWYRGSPRLQTTRPGTNGAFSIRGLPPGGYLLAALTDVEQDEWQDPEFLAQLAPAAVRLTITAGQRTVQDLRIR